VAAAATPAILNPGECVALSCDAPNQTPDVVMDVTAVADDPGTGVPAYNECLSTNNRMTAAGVQCPYVG
jgi:hypothetical protein